MKFATDQSVANFRALNAKRSPSFFFFLSSPPPLLSSVCSAAPARLTPLQPLRSLHPASWTQVERIREVHERAIANVPPAEEKRYWQRYIYLWINYALYEELDVGDIERTRDVYRECLNLIPHKKFSFAKIWLLAAQFEIRQLNLAGARQILGNAIGKAPKDKIFKKYIEIELQLGNIDHCGKLYEKYLECILENCYAWSKYAELERSLAETDRARAIFELPIAQPTLGMPELLWKAYIDFEISEGEYDRTRQLYERLLDRTKPLKVWVSYAKFKASAMDEVVDGADSLEERRRVLFGLG
ncbi:hypothetical protein JCGZ_20040 [Jatropha curcas]|uniref:Pre-mRNA-splicing factor Syf1/CRNKL1-like C-terminal HAT-repeats domain-containing protein n=1 Tax=Jatropha curcas TaxID=180498 RepID=A0A067LID4_JATCU|nr:hypothetical protein JCGZ_20040 [Jatropha curcas]